MRRRKIGGAGAFSRVLRFFLAILPLILLIADNVYKLICKRLPLEPSDELNPTPCKTLPCSHLTTVEWCCKRPQHKGCYLACDI